MRTLFVLFSFFVVLFTNGQNIITETQQTLKSPNGDYVFKFYQKEIAAGEKQMYYTLSFKDKIVINESELGVLIENQTFESALAVPNDTCRIWGENLLYTGTVYNSFDEQWKPVYGESDSIRNHYNAMIVSFKKGSDDKVVESDGYDKRKGYFMNVEVRAYNEGIAFRYHFPEPTNGLFLHITGEQTQFTMPDETLAYFEGWAQGPYSLLPLKNWNGQSERPLTMKLKNGLAVAIAEAQMIDYARMKLSLNEHNENTLQASLYSSVDVIPAYSTPWRVVMAGEKSIDLIKNKDLILNLNTENELNDVSWIKPGKVIRVAKMTQEGAKACVDFASERNLQYIHIDAGWYGPEMKKNSDATTVSETKDFDIPSLTAYAASKGIGLWVYVNQRALVQQLDSILPLYKKWGIKGIKFGFVQVGNQNWSTWLHDAVKKCAEYGLMVDIHDEYRPTGFSRTYPNLMTQEGIRGNEEMPDANHNTILPFTRYLAGPADYTICYYNSRVKNTHAHQLALSVIYYSPIQFLYWYDQPSAYKGEPEIEFFDKVKTVWNETKIQNGEIGEYITVARRSGDEWFVGSITNNSPKTVGVPLNFLNDKQKYVARIYTDDNTVNSRTKVRISTIVVTKQSLINFQLKANGGATMYIVPATKSDLKKYRFLSNKGILL